MIKSQKNPRTFIGGGSFFSAVRALLAAEEDADDRAPDVNK